MAQLAVVSGREIDDQVTTFGTTGYTKNHVFVLYDRLTNSVWYPLEDGAFDAVAGPQKGAQLEFLDKPEVMTLSKWAELHPDSKILLPPARPDSEWIQTGFWDNPIRVHNKPERFKKIDR